MEGVGSEEQCGSSRLQLLLRTSTWGKAKITQVIRRRGFVNGVLPLSEVRHAVEAIYAELSLREKCGL